MQHIYLNHKLIPAQEALIPVTDRGFRFGDGVFETIRVHEGVPYRFEWHMARLCTGLAAISIDFDTKSLRIECADIVRKNQCSDGLLRIQITRGTSGSGYLPAKAPATCVIETLPLTPAPSESISLYLSTYRRTPAACLPVHAKLAQGINSTLARMEAETHSCFEALQLNIQGIIAECSSSNIFWRKNNTLYTPALDCGILNGAIRAAIFFLYPQKIYEAHEVIEAVASADAVCITNSSWLALPVKHLSPNNFMWESTQMAEEFNHLLMNDMRAYTKANRQHW
ncbi:MAG: aminotransferase class IV [Alphaproteobacteria bacterium]